LEEDCRRVHEEDILREMVKQSGKLEKERRKGEDTDHSRVSSNGKTLAL
jgi:hypothetical protein